MTKLQKINKKITNKKIKRIFYEAIKLESNLKPDGYDYIILQYDIPQELYYNSTLRHYLYQLREGLKVIGQSVVMANAKNEWEIRRILMLYNFLRKLSAKVDILLARRVRHEEEAISYE